MSKPKYSVIKSLGKGGMGEVFLVELEGDGSFRKKAALKQQLAGQRSSLDFEKEANLLAKLDHPNIVSVYNYWVENQQPHILLEYVGGVTLEDILNQLESKRSALPSELVAEITMSLLHVLEYLQKGVEKNSSEKILHMDITPHNVKIDEQGQLKLLDFGVSKTLNTEVSSRLTYNIVGKPGYFAPELINENRQSPAADLFSVGIIAWELLMGERLFPSREGSSPIGKIAALTREQVEALCSQLPAMGEAVKKLLDPNPRDRMSSMAEAKRLVRNVHIQATRSDKNLLDRIRAFLEVAPQRGGGALSVVELPKRQPQGSVPLITGKWDRISPTIRLCLGQVAPFAGAAGIMTDLSTPIANYLGLFTWIAVSISVVLLLAWHVLRSPTWKAKLPLDRWDPEKVTIVSQPERLRHPVYIFVTISVIFCMLSAVRVAAHATDKGILASTFPGVEKLQASLFHLEKVADEMNQKIDRIESTISKLDRRYSIDELARLKDNEVWDEVLAHADDIEPTARDERWFDIIEAAAYGALKERVKIEDFKAAAHIATPLFEKNRVLKKSERLMQLRKSIGLKDLEACLAATPLQDCHARSLAYIEYEESKRGELAFDVGVLTTYHRFHRGALPYFLIGIEENPSSERCKNERLQMAIDNTAEWNKDDPLTETANKIAKTCGLKRSKNH